MQIVRRAVAAGEERGKNNKTTLVLTMSWEDLKDRLGEIAAPTLVVGGDRDAFYGPRLFAETAKQIRDGRVVIYRNAGHLGTLSNGKRLARDVLGFLA